MKLIITRDLDDLSLEVAKAVTAYIKKIAAVRERVTIVLSGGSTPGKLYELLASPEFKNLIDWSKLHFFWGDERYVPFTDKRNNAKMAFDILLNQVPVNKDHIHTMRTDLEPEDAAVQYEELLHEYFPDADHTFDLVLLGMGDNAHTLSLFPGYEVVHEKKQWVKSFYLAEEKMYRITLTAPVINGSGRVIFLVSGAGKAAMLNYVLSGEYDPALYPAQAIQPFNDDLYWYVDQRAAADLRH